MSIGDFAYLSLSVAAFAFVFALGRDEPFAARFSIALLVGLLWLPVLIVFAVMLLVDGAAWLIRKVRQ